ncbi:MAG: type 2 lanthipeptide synthetase LanM family protein [Pyrinomonadaceae bacterium]
MATDGLDEDSFRHLLGEPIAAVRARCCAPPEWLVEFASAFSQSETCPAETFPLPEALRAKPVAGFLHLIAPLIRQGRAQVAEGVRRLAERYEILPFAPDTIVEVLSVNLPWKLVGMMSRTLILELNVARLEGFLAGETPEQRFASFIERLHGRETALGLLQEYAVLVRQLTQTVQQWVAFSLEFLAHLCADWTDLRATFSAADEPGVLVQLKGDAGDSHRRGQSVVIATFDSGFQVVYKPRSLAVDLHFQELLAWLNENGAHPPFHLLKILERGAHGWVEFVAAQSCTSLAEVRRFYRRQGAYLALLYALEATDLHFENLIAAGEQPILIDLESLFQARVTGIDIKQTDLQLATQTAIHSVLRVGLLPQRMLSGEDYEGIDMSGLGGIAGQLSPERAVKLEKMGTDEMHVSRQRVGLPEGQHRPQLNGEMVNTLDYTAEIIEGFTGMYRLLLKERAYLLSAKGPLVRFAEDEVRAIVRDTHTYSLLLHESFHPDLLRNALDRDRFFDRLWVGIANHPYRARVISSEQDDLHHGDIPIFSTRPNSRHLWNSMNELAADFFDETGLALVERRMQQLDETDLAKQVWFIRASLTTLSIDLIATKWPSYVISETQIIADRKQLLAAACRVGDRLAALALRNESDVMWFGLNSVRETHCTLTALDHNLYEGLPGVILFLAYLGFVSGDERYHELAQAALTTLRRQLERGRSTIKRVGAFDGWGGIIYLLTHLSLLWRDDALVAEAHEIAARLPELIEQDESFDIVGGSAGCIAGLISLNAVAPVAQVLAAAVQCGDRLIANAQRMERGIGWLTPAPAQKPPSGFSHGVAGIAWALLKLHELSGQQRFRAAALDAIEYERSLFSPEEGNWLDQRDLGSFSRSQENGKRKTITAWCYGAPGIGLARLSTLAHLDDAVTRAEIGTALQTTCANGFGQNHSLCHGDLGNIELLCEAGARFADSRWHSEAKRLSGVILDSINRNGWLCGLPLGIESPGLMTGLAGIGYGLLRLCEPEQVPSILTLQPPSSH